MLPPQYEQVELLGSGANANVYRAFDTKKNQWVTFKWAIQALSRHVLFRLRWLQEVMALQKISSAHIVSLLEHGVWQDRPYMVLQYAKETLQEALQRPQTVRTRFRWLAEVLEAISVLHVHGFVHQDINLENILIEKGQAWLTDFSVVRSIDVLRVDSTEVSGTMGWWAPEQQRRDGKWIDARTDIYSWGRMAHHLFQESAIWEYVCDIIAKATAESPVSRFDSAAELRSIFLRRIEHIPESILDMQEHVGVALPAHLDVPIPQINRVKNDHFTLPPIASQSGQILRKEIRDCFEQCLSLQKPSVLVVEDCTQEARDIIDDEVCLLHIHTNAKVISIDYEFFDGVLHQVREWVAPTKESHADTVKRIVQKMLYGRKCNSVQQEKEANSLVLWARRNILVEKEIGLLFFIQRIQEYTQHGPVILLLHHPNIERDGRDGVELCALLLSELFLSLPICMLLSLPKEAHHASIVVGSLCAMGAKSHRFSAPSQETFATLVSKDSALWYQICSGDMHIWRLLRSETCNSSDTYESVIKRALFRMENSVMASTKQLVCALALSKRPIPLYACREYAEELEEALAYPWLEIKGRWILFSNTKAKEFCAQKADNHAARMLADLWRRAEHEDSQERNICWSYSMMFCGSASTAIPILMKTMVQCFAFGRYQLVKEAIEIALRCRLSSSYTKQVQYFELFIEILESNSFGNWSEKIAHATKKEREELLALLLQEKKRGMDWSKLLEDSPKDGAYLVVEAEIARDHGNLVHAISLFQEALGVIEEKSMLWMIILAAKVEISLFLKESEGVEEAVFALLSHARQLASMRSMAYASYVDALFCMSEKRLQESSMRFRHASAMAFLCGQKELWARSLSFLALVLLKQNKEREARVLLERKKDICILQGRSCVEACLELWVLWRNEDIPVPVEGEDLLLWKLQQIIIGSSKVSWKEVSKEVVSSIHPFVPLFLRELPHEVLSLVEKESLLEQISW